MNTLRLGVAWGMLLALTCKTLAGDGSVTGVIQYDPKAPKPRLTLKMDTDPQCARQWAGKAAPREQIGVVSDDGGLANVFVWISKGVPNQKFPVPKESVVINQVGCLYTPHVVGVIAGQTIEFHNGDATLHNIHTYPDPKFGNKSINIAQPGKGIVTKTDLKNPELGVLVKCDVHQWMNCQIHVMDHPFFAVTDTEGKFTIKGLPPGKYTVSFKHELSDKVLAPDKQDVEIDVKADAEAKVEVTYIPSARYIEGVERAHKAQDEEQKAKDAAKKACE